MIYATKALPCGPKRNSPFVPPLRSGEGERRVSSFLVRMAGLWLRRSFRCSPRSIDGSVTSAQSGRAIRARPRAAAASHSSRTSCVDLLRNRGILDLKFRRQHVLHGFIVDFYCASARIVIELEGDVHDAEVQREYDHARAGFLQAAGYRVIRVRNRDVSREQLEAVLRTALGSNC